jgi:hypothetical protein
MHSISKTVFDKLCENAQIKEQAPALAKVLLFLVRGTKIG